jgi:hypothetical protein
MSYNEIQRAFWDNSIHAADLQTLRECLNLVIQQSGPGEPRASEFAQTIRSIIRERENQTRHQEASRQAKAQHEESQVKIEQVSIGISDLKTQVNATNIEVSQIKTALKKIHAIDVLILWASIFAALFAAAGVAIALYDECQKQTPNNSSDVAPKPVKPEPTNSTNK